MKIQIVTVGKIVHAYRLAGERWLPIAVSEARRLLALGKAREATS